MNKSKQAAQWFATYENELAKRADHKPGQVCWDTATHLYNKGLSPQVAAQHGKNPYK